MSLVPRSSTTSTYGSVMVERESGSVINTIPLEQLGKYCWAALHSQDKDERQYATNQLRYLSHSSQWGALQDIMQSTNDENVMFIANKALMFIVSNEIGPEERKEVQTFLLKLVSTRTQNGDTRAMPNYVVRSILNVFAVAFFLNWRMMAITLDDDTASDGTTPDSSSLVGRKIEEQLSSMLSKELVLYAMSETLHRFTLEDQRLRLNAVRTAFATKVLPYFFCHAVDTIINEPTVAQSAWELAYQCLDFVPPPAIAPLVNFRAAMTEETLYVSPLQDWLPATLGIHEKANYFLGGGGSGTNSTSERRSAANPWCDESLQALRCCRSIACIDLSIAISDNGESPMKRGDSSNNDNGFGDAGSSGSLSAQAKQAAAAGLTEDGLFDFIARNITLLRLATEAMGSWMSSGGEIPAEHLNEAVRAVCNVFERYPDPTAVQISKEMPLLHNLVALTQASAVYQHSEEEESLRNALLLFFTLLQQHYVDNPYFTEFAWGGGSSDPTNGGFDVPTLPTEDAMDTMMTHSHIADLVKETTLDVLTKVITHFHMQEGTAEVNTNPEAMEIHAEKLKPLATLISLQLDTVGPLFSTMIKDTCQAYESCLLLNTGQTVSAPAMVQVTQVLSSGEDKTSAKRGSSFWVGKILSRLTVCFELVAILLQLRSAQRVFMEDSMGDQSLLASCVKFVGSFLQDDLSEQLLTSLSLLDTTLGDDDNTMELEPLLGATGPTPIVDGPPAGSFNNRNSVGNSRSNNSREHVGILRAVIYFASSLKETVFFMQDIVVDMMATVVCRILKHHSGIVSSSGNRPIPAVVPLEVSRLFLALLMHENTPNTFLDHAELLELFDLTYKSQIPVTSYNLHEVSLLDPASAHLEVRKVFGHAVMVYAEQKSLREAITKSSVPTIAINGGFSHHGNINVPAKYGLSNTDPHFSARAGGSTSTLGDHPAPRRHRDPMVSMANSAYASRADSTTSFSATTHAPLSALPIGCSTGSPKLPQYSTSTLEEGTTLDILLKRTSAFLSQFHGAMKQDQLDSHEQWTSCCRALFSDLTGLGLGVKYPGTLNSLLSWFLEHGKLMRQILMLNDEATTSATTHVDPAMMVSMAAPGAPAMTKILEPHRLFLTLLATWSENCKEMMTEDFSADDVGLPFAKYVIEFCLDVLRCMNDAQAREEMKHTEDCNYRGADENSTSRNGKILCDIGKIVHCVFSGGFCNLGVMLYYGDNSPDTLLVFSLIAFLDVVDVDQVMALPEEREFLFKGISAVQKFRSPSKEIQDHMNEKQVVQRTTASLLRCLEHTPLAVIIYCLTQLVVTPLTRRCLEERDVVPLFREIVVLICTGAYDSKDKDILHMSCTIISTCYRAFEAQTTSVIEGLLDFASAFHRVRLRCLLMMLQSGPQSQDDLHESFSNIFSNMNNRAAAGMTPW